MKVKKIILVMFLILMITAQANIYAMGNKLEGTDMDISLNEDEWNICTRSVYNEKVLHKIGISSDRLNNFMTENSIYLYGLPSNDNEEFKEFLLIKKKSDEVSNFINLTKKDFIKVAKELNEIENVNEYELYENSYRFLRLRYNDKGLDIESYVTIVNGYLYKVNIQKQSGISQADSVKLKEIVDSIEFDIDRSMPENYKVNNIELNVILKYALIIVISLAIATVIIRLISLGRSNVVDSKISLIILTLVIFAVIKIIFKI